MAPIRGALTAAETEEMIERRLAEIQFIETAYSPEEAQASVREGAVANGCTIVRVLQLPIEGAGRDAAILPEADHAVARIKLSLEMPDFYPLLEQAILKLNAWIFDAPSNPPFIRKAALLAIPQLVKACEQTAREASAAQGGGETVWAVLSRAEEWIDSEWTRILEEHSGKALVDPQRSRRPSLAEASGNTLGRRIIYSHHIIANSKRRGLADLASRHNLGGYAKIGWPGVILIEGGDTDCQMFVDEIKRWRWQQIQVRGEEQELVPEAEPLDAHRKLPMKFEEIGEDGMSLLARQCREHGLEQLFLTCMNIHDRRTVGEENPDTAHYGVFVHVDHMNDGKRYRKWLRKTCQAQGCALLIRQCFSEADADRDRPIICVGIFGDAHGAKQVMKLWRTSRVDVDAKGTPCLERRMSVIQEGAIPRVPDTSSAADSEDLHCSFRALESLVISIHAGWGQEVRERLMCPD